MRISTLIKRKGENMNEPIEEPKRISRRKGKVDMKVGTIKHHKARSGITRKEFHSILDKASQPIKREVESDSERP
jgi:hypothetical protein